MLDDANADLRLPMIQLQAIWTRDRLHVWGTHAAERENAEASKRQDAKTSSRPTDNVTALDEAVDLDELRGLTGDAWDSLLISGATHSELRIRLPFVGGALAGPVDGDAAAAEFSGSDSTMPRSEESGVERGDDSSIRPLDVSTIRAVEFRTVSIPTLSFSPADAVDFLTMGPARLRPPLSSGDSYCFWRRVALLGMELLAKQRYVPAVHRDGVESYRGYWRVLVDDEGTSGRVRALIAAMPPICRAWVEGDRAGEAQQGESLRSPEGAELVEGFLWRAVDAVVRRCMEGDELTHALLDHPESSATPPMLWLRSLVSSDGRVLGDAEKCRTVHKAVSEWLAKLEPPAPARLCTTCLRLRPPSRQESPGQEVSSSESDHAVVRPTPPQQGESLLSTQQGESSLSPLSWPWTLSIYARTTGPASVKLGPQELCQPRKIDEPHILPRPFDHALEQVRADLARAARYFPPLGPCGQIDGPLELSLSTDEAYTFLRDAVPMLEHDGVVVETPRWWRDRARPRLRMRLDIRPADAGEREMPFEPQGASGLDSGRLGLGALVDYDWRVAVGDEELTVEELTELASAKAPLVRLRGHWIEARPAEARQALEFLEGQRGGRMTVFEALRQCYLADDLETGLPVAGVRAHGWVDRLLSASGDAQAISFAPQPAAFQGELRPYQLRGMAWLRFLSGLGLGACLADDMGLGKTIQLIALLLHERESDIKDHQQEAGAKAQVGGGEASALRGSGPTLLVVPTSLVGNWHRELARFAPSLRVLIHHGLDRLSGERFQAEAPTYDVVISTYSLTHRDFDHLSTVQWHRVTLDEAQNIKNPAAKQSVALHALSAVHRVALTGTPVENRLSELWSILDFLNPGYLGTAGDFRRRFAVPIERHHDPDRAERLRDLIKPFILRRLKSDPNIEADLPEKMEMKVYCNLTREQASLYEAIVKDMLEQIDRSEGMQRRGLILAALVKLKQVCNHPAHFLAEPAADPQRSGKCDRLTGMLEEVLAEGDRALIFTQFKKMGDLLQRSLEQALGCNVLFLHGGTTRLKRDAMVERFQDPDGNAPLFLLSLKAGGFGLNLTAASHVFHFDRWWNPAVEDQATDRAHRVGQHRRVQVHKFVCAGTLEERIDQLLTQKRALADRIVGSGEDWLTELSTEQLRDLFALSSDAVADE
jgi:hypothetical protein